MTAVMMAPMEQPYKLVTKPIEVPTAARSGELIEFLEKVVKLDATSIDTGLSPHYEWLCETKKAMRSRASGLQIARRKLMKREPKFRKLSLMQRSLLRGDKEVFVIYAWMEG